MGAYSLSDTTVRALVNHELLHFRGNEYYIDSVRDSDGELKGLKGARVSYFDIDKTTLEVVGSGIAYERIYGFDGTEVDGTPEGDGFAFLFSLQGFSRFCSGRLVQPELFGKGKGIVDLIYFAPEEDGGFFNRNGGAVWALDVEEKNFWQVPAFGRGAWVRFNEMYASMFG